MKHTPVESSTISTISYDEDKKEMMVKFTTGARYTYHAVPPETHKAFLMSSSKGKFLHEHIKGNHEHTKL